MLIDETDRVQWIFKQTAKAHNNGTTTQTKTKRVDNNGFHNPTNRRQLEEKYENLIVDSSQINACCVYQYDDVFGLLVLLLNNTIFKAFCDCVATTIMDSLRTQLSFRIPMVQNCVYAAVYACNYVYHVYFCCAFRSSSCLWRPSEHVIFDVFMYVMFYYLFNLSYVIRSIERSNHAIWWNENTK